TGLFPGDEVVTQGSYALAFAGSGSGMSLKEALDAAHGHEHNDDGSEMTEAQKAAREAEGRQGKQSRVPSLWLWVVVAWAGMATLLMLVFAQKAMNAKTPA
ncbi:MAG: hypothetical protein AAGC68_01260, partial [Verrucomicrobiota bacterium]